MLRKLKALFLLTGLLCLSLTLPAMARTPVPRKDSASGSVSGKIAVPEIKTSTLTRNRNLTRAKRSSGHAAGDVIVVMKDSQSASSSSVQISAQAVRINAVASSVNAKVKKTYPALSRNSDNKIFALVHSDSKSETELLKELRANPDVIGVSLNHRVFAFASGTPNDTYYNQLWGLKAIKADKLWAKGYTGSSNNYVAVIDTGIKSNHEDLSANFYSGYSKGFVNNSSSYNDGDGHGTHVSGTIAAVGNNSKGVTGINWTAKVIALKALDDEGLGYLDDIIEALNYLSSILSANPSMNLAAVNLSLGFYVSDTPAQMISNKDAMWVALDTFSKKNRAVICVAAGNEGLAIGVPAPSSNSYYGYNKGDYCYPASYKNIDNMISVAASNNDSSYSRAEFSNYSTSYVDIAAPGVNIISTVANSNKYESYSGTSMATPHVAGAAALLKSIVPSATASQIKNAIIKGANTSYAKGYTKYGFLDVESALSILQGASSPIKLSISGSFSNGTAGTSYSSSVTASGGSSYSWSSSGSIPTGLKISYSGAKAVLSGTPTKAGTYSFTLKVSSGGVSISKTFSVTIAAQAQKLALNGTFASAFKGVEYSSKISASGGTSPYYWSYNGTLPPGLGLYYVDSAGKSIELYGTPYTTGTYKFSLYAEDNNGNEVSKTFSVTVSALSKLAISGSLSNGVKGASYNKAVKATGGLSPYTWSYTGKMPSGLKIYKANSSGTSINIKGTPTSSGTYSFTLKLKDSLGTSVSKSYKISITVPYITGTFKGWSVGRSYTDTVTFGGGTAPYKFTRTGTLPAGLKLIMSGTKLKLYGKPTKSGKYTFKVKLTDKNNIAVTKSFTVNIAKTVPAFSGTFKSGTAGSSYTSTVNLTGGTKSYKLTKSGTLPTGLKLTLSGTKAKLTGKPTKKGSYKFKLTVTDKNGVATSKTFTVKITQPAVTGTLSNGTVNKSYSDNVAITGGTAPYKCTRTGTIPSGLKLTFSGTKAKLTGKPTRAGKYSFTLKFTDKDKNAVSKKFTVTISQAKSTNKKAVTQTQTQSQRVNASTGIAPHGGLAHIAGVNQSPLNFGGGSVLYIAPERIKLRISEDDILESGINKDEDLFTVKANEPVTFIIENYKDLSDVTIFFDFEPYEGGDIKISDEGAFTLPAELVHDDFVVSVKAKIKGREAESEEIYINAE